MKKYKIVVSTWKTKHIEEIKEYYVHAFNAQEAKQELKQYMNDTVNFISCSHFYEGF